MKNSSRKTLKTPKTIALEARVLALASQVLKEEEARHEQAIALAAARVMRVEREYDNALSRLDAAKEGVSSFEKALALPGYENNSTLLMDVAKAWAQVALLRSEYANYIRLWTAAKEAHTIARSPVTALKEVVSKLSSLQTPLGFEARATAVGLAKHFVNAAVAAATSQIQAVRVCQMHFDECQVAVKEAREKVAAAQRRYNLFRVASDRLSPPARYAFSPYLEADLQTRSKSLSLPGLAAAKVEAAQELDALTEEVDTANRRLLQAEKRLARSLPRNLIALQRRVEGLAQHVGAGWQGEREPELENLNQLF